MIELSKIETNFDAFTLKLPLVLRRRDIKLKCSHLRYSIKPQYLKYFQQNWINLVTWVQAYVTEQANESFYYVKMKLPVHAPAGHQDTLRVRSKSAAGGLPMKDSQFSLRNPSGVFPDKTLESRETSRLIPNLQGASRHRLNSPCRLRNE